MAHFPNTSHLFNNAKDACLAFVYIYICIFSLRSGCCLYRVDWVGLEIRSSSSPRLKAFRWCHLLCWMFVLNKKTPSEGEREKILYQNNIIRKPPPSRISTICIVCACQRNKRVSGLAHTQIRHTFLHIPTCHKMSLSADRIMASQAFS